MLIDKQYIEKIIERRKNRIHKKITFGFKETIYRKKGRSALRESMISGNNSEDDFM